jgi:hypothetical protein
VAVEPDGVTTWTVVSEIGTVAVVVLPAGVRMCETTGDEATEIVVVPPLMVTAETEVGAGLTDGELTKDETDSGTV